LTVAELMKKLDTMPSDMEVVVSFSLGYKETLVPAHVAIDPVVEKVVFF
jgi:hypothetical protein